MIRKRISDLLRAVAGIAPDGDLAAGLMPGLQDILVFGGLAAACYGIHQVFAPGAWIVGGAACFWLGVRKL